MSGGPTILRPEIVEEDNQRRDEREPNPEEEGQPAPPDEIDGEDEQESRSEQGKAAE